MGLRTYRQKRNFERTPEPSGGKSQAARTRKRAAGAPIFVIQKHDATRLHYDFRLEIGGVLVSWSVPKGPSKNPGDKRLAVRTEDHPMEYAKFSGRIPKGSYGAGTVEIWDRGTFESLTDPHAGLRKGKLEIRLHGDRLEGEWHLVRMQPRPEDRGRENWLLIRARADADAEAARTPSRTARTSAARAALPRFVAPQLATLVKQAPEGDEWLHEMKLDGYRILCRLQNGRVQLVSRYANDWTARFSRVAEAARALPAEQALLDGEVVVLDEHGISDFQALQSVVQRGGQGLQYFVFDLLHRDGVDLRARPLEERKRALEELLDNVRRDPVLRYCDHVIGKGPAFHAEACRRGLEGIVSKKRDGRYVSGRTKSWLKAKCGAVQEFVIGGYTDPAGSRSHFGSLLLGVHEDGKLRYAGRVGTGFSDDSLRDLFGKLERRRVERSPFTAGAKPPRAAHWVRPDLVAEVGFATWTREGLLRQATYRGLREDKPAREIVRERPGATPPAKTPAKKGARARTTEPPPPARGMAVRAAGVALTNPDRVLYPEVGLTKLDLVQHYQEVASRMIPDVSGRPLMLLRCPEGRGKACFFQKHPSGTFPGVLGTIEIQERTKRETYLYLTDAAGLAALVQMGALEIHHWGSRADRLERPDRMVFDLDPDERVPWPRVVELAHRLRERLQSIDLESFLKTTGGKGLHLVVPIRRAYDFEEVRSFAAAVADSLKREDPKSITTTLSKAARPGKILIDIYRNGRGATWVAAYSTRARAGAPVSMPIPWSALTPELRSDEFRAGTLRDALRRKDPWADLQRLRQPLSASARKKLER